MISGIGTLTSNPITKKLKLLPYAIVGGAAFALNANPETNVYLQIYMTLLEAKLGVVLVYLLSKKLTKIPKEKHSA
ncbi:MAG: hypothetical protein ACK5EU_15045 [Pseudanabaena sp.]|jgi:hypothetical protein|uniref:hypothetical protein n=1 Tax=Pseudanabaena mucicola TaxID=71190 RepID=UPI0025776911|nr:hypothetical protein [Pseudanabaena mucicola]MCA6585299.1 hypothetical protein [Pseudanabaena sp. M051S1SP1A06QC]MCA6588425.1 hypothetical protein [Pseudanabaena sp. M109S1SP1A06QC]MCA6604802.1 hypothetical protein [Pseudanabaena sp. M007S1SP1A06QC]MCA6615062.1 hypothetical protein [Pseudanabaena sp. M090S1SP1A06QC]MCA6624649.1 hypothetical protein [Pseudanabaena sp. M165S2SP1A06QC]